MTDLPTRRGTTTLELRAAQAGRAPTTGQLTLLDLLSRGYTVRRAARELRVSINTAKVQVRRLYARLDADNAAHAVRRGFELGLLRRDDDDPAAASEEERD